MRGLAWVPFLTVTFVLGLPPPLPAQILAGALSAPPGTWWSGMVVFEAGRRLFIADNTNAQLLVYDADSLAPAGQVSLAAYLPDRPQYLDIHQATGTIYVSVSAGFATSETTIVVIDAATASIKKTFTGLGWDAAVTVDEARSRAYVWCSQAILTAIDVGTNTLLGSLNVGALMTSGLVSFGLRQSLNPVTGELLFANIHADELVIVNGVALTGQRISGSGARGFAGTWNTLENKAYITTITWTGYFSYDRDTGASAVTTCVNDASTLRFSAYTNSVYTGSEINGDSTRISGATDACQNFPIGSGYSILGVADVKHHLYYVRAGAVKVLDEPSMAQIASFDSCTPQVGGGVDDGIVVDSSTQRVFVRVAWNKDTSCINVIDDGSPATAFHTVTPCRLVDTRGAAGTYGGPALTPGSDRVFPLAGRCGLPATARAVSVNLTATAPTAPGNLRLYPAGTSLPTTSSLNYSGGQTRGNNAIVSLNQRGELAVHCAQASGTTHFTLDVNGYFE